jgi:hypothetical protein
LSLRNQYDTKTPRASLFAEAAKQPAFSSGPFSPVPRVAGKCSRHEKIHSVGFEMSGENFFRKNEFEKFPRNSRITAGLLPPKGRKVILNLAFGRKSRKPSKGTGARRIPCGKLKGSKRRERRLTGCARENESLIHSAGRPWDRHKWRDAREYSRPRARRRPRERRRRGKLRDLLELLRREG